MRSWRYNSETNENTPCLCGICVCGGGRTGAVTGTHAPRHPCPPSEQCAGPSPVLWFPRWGLPLLCPTLQGNTLKTLKGPPRDLLMRFSVKAEHPLPFFPFWGQREDLGHQQHFTKLCSSPLPPCLGCPTCSLQAAGHSGRL